MIDLARIRAIDVHVHAEVSCHEPEDPIMGQFFDAASAYIKAPRERHNIPQFIELCRLSGWTPKYFPPQLIQYANRPLKCKILFGSDFPLIHHDVWIQLARHVGFKEEVLAGILKNNAARLLGLDREVSPS